MAVQPSASYPNSSSISNMVYQGQVLLSTVLSSGIPEDWANGSIFVDPNDGGIYLYFNDTIYKQENDTYIEVASFSDIQFAKDYFGDF